MHSNDKNSLCRLAACTPRDENGMPENRCRHKGHYLSSSTLVPDSIGDPRRSMGSSVFALFFVREENATGFPITNVGNDRFGLFSYQGYSSSEYERGESRCHYQPLTHTIEAL